MGVGAGDRSSNERRLGGSVVGRDGGGLKLSLDEEASLGGDFSGLLGGVLKGETLGSGEARSARGAKVLVSG